MFDAKLLTALALAGFLFAPADSARGDTDDVVSGITTTLRSYEATLNASDTDSVMELYAADGVFMPQHFPSAVGQDQVRAAYDGVFATIRLDIDFDIFEVVPISDDWALARTNLAGTVTVLASSESGPEANQELFAFFNASMALGRSPAMRFPRPTRHATDQIVAEAGAPIQRGNHGGRLGQNNMLTGAVQRFG